jgi:undecaprenyl-diphosphatase
MINELILAFIQAATEFLPISSSGHLALFAKTFYEPDLSFFIFLHFASLLAVLIFTRKEIFKLLKFDKRSLGTIGFIVLATLPAIIFYLLFGSFIENTFKSYFYIGISYLLISLFLLSTKNFKGDKKVGWKDSLFVGIFQAFALFPGISRSGITISSARLMGVSKEEAFKFSFLIFIPLVLGAILKDILFEGSQIYFSTQFILPFIVTFIFSLFFLKILQRTLEKNNFWMFGFYCMFVGIVSLIMHYI